MKVERDFILDPSLALYLPLYELDGASIMSRDAYGHLCTVTGALWRADGRYFDGLDDYIDLGSSFQSILRGSFSIGCWIKPTDGQSATAETFLGCNNAASEDRINCQVKEGGDAGKIILAYESNNNVARAMTDRAVFGDGQQAYHQVWLVAHSLNGIQVYFDGVNEPLDATWNGDVSGVTFADWTSDDELFAGAYDDNGVAQSHFGGSIGELYIVRRAVSPLEIQRKYLATKWRYR